MLAKIRAAIEWLLGTKVGNGFSFLLYFAGVLVYGFVTKAPFLEVSGALFAGLGVQTGQRTYTQVKLSKAEAACAATNGTDTK